MFDSLKIFLVLMKVQIEKLKIVIKTVMLPIFSVQWCHFLPLRVIMALLSQVRSIKWKINPKSLSAFAGSTLVGGQPL